MNTKNLFCQTLNRKNSIIFLVNFFLLTGCVHNSHKTQDNLCTFHGAEFIKIKTYHDGYVLYYMQNETIKSDYISPEMKYYINSKFKVGGIIVCSSGENYEENTEELLIPEL